MQGIEGGGRLHGALGRVLGFLRLGRRVEDFRLDLMHLVRLVAGLGRLRTESAVAGARPECVRDEVLPEILPLVRARAVEDELLHRSQIPLDLLNPCSLHEARELGATITRVVVAQETQECVPELERRLVARGARAAHRLLDDPAELLGDVGVDLHAGRGVRVAHGEDQIDLVRRVEGRRVGGELVENAPGAEEIRAPVELAAEGLLRAHVLDLALDDPRLRLDPVVCRLRDPEVAELHGPVVADQEVRGAEVAVNDLERLRVLVTGDVGVVKPVERTGEDVGDVVETELHAPRAGLLDGGAKILAVDVLHRDEEVRVDLHQLEDLGDVRMLQVADELELVGEHRDELLVFQEVREQPLDGHVPFEAVSFERECPEQLGHPAERDSFRQMVSTEPLGAAHSSGQSASPGRGTASTDARIPPSTLAQRGDQLGAGQPRESSDPVDAGARPQLDLRHPIVVGPGRLRGWARVPLARVEKPACEGAVPRARARAHEVAPRIETTRRRRVPIGAKQSAGPGGASASRARSPWPFVTRAELRDTRGPRHPPRASVAIERLGADAGHAGGRDVGAAGRVAPHAAHI